MSRNPEMNAEVREKLEDVVAIGVFTYTNEFTRDLFPDYTAPPVQDCIVSGLARAIRMYEGATGRPFASALALALLEPKD